MPLLYFVGSVIRDRGEEPTYDGFLWCVDPDDLLGPGGGPRDPEPVRFAAVGEPEEAETLARLLNDGESLKAQRDALLTAAERIAGDVRRYLDRGGSLTDREWESVDLLREAIALARKEPR